MKLNLEIIYEALRETVSADLLGVREKALHLDGRSIISVLTASSGQGIFISSGGSSSRPDRR